MLDRLQIIVDKLIASEDLHNPKHGVVSFVNPYSAIRLAKAHGVDLPEVDGLYSDGFYMTWLLKLIYGRKITRRSFDRSSIALMILRKHRVAIIGGSEEELQIFTKRLQQEHDISVLPLSHGYVTFDEDNLRVLHSRMQEEDKNVLVLGLGCPKQEEVALAFKRIAPGILIYTCGAFISQSAKSNTLQYYPEWTDKFNLRWAYRLYKEPHTIQRLPRVITITLYTILNRLKNGKR